MTVVISIYLAKTLVQVFLILDWRQKAFSLSVESNSFINLASFPGISRIQFLIACSMHTGNEANLKFINCLKINLYQVW